MQHKFEAVVFDMDGILFDSERLVIGCWKEVAQKHGVSDVEETCRKCLGVNAAGARAIFLDTYGQDFPYDAYKAEMSALYHSRYDNGRLPMKEGVEELLEYLQTRGKRIGLASSTRSQVVFQELADAGIAGYFDHIVGGDMVAKSKPEPDIFLKACEALGVLPEEAFAVEDSYNGIRAASAGKLRPLMVPDLMPPTEEMRQLAEGIFDSLKDVKRYLEAF